MGHRPATKGLCHEVWPQSKGYISPLVPHRYAKNFLEKFNDIALLSYLMEHESIETTRIYLRYTASRQQEIVNIVITW